MSQIVVHSNPWFTVTSRQHADRTWYQVDAPDSAILVGRTERNGILVVRGHRPATRGTQTLELPGGIVEPGETPLDAAAREAAEETGYRAHDCRLLGAFHPISAISATRCHVIAARVTPAGPPRLEQGEDWAVEVVDAAAVPALVASGAIQDGATLSALALALIPAAEQVHEG